MADAQPILSALSGRAHTLAPAAMLPGGLSAAALPQPDFLPSHSLSDSGPRPDPSIHLRVLIVEDDPPVRQACAEIASGLGYSVETAESVPAARITLQRSAVDILLLDLRLPGGGGISLLQEVREVYPRIDTVVMTAFASVNSAVEAMRTGAADYLAKPFTLEELITVLERAAERRKTTDESRALRERLRLGKAAGALIGQTAPMEKLFRIMSKVAYTSHPALIFGESGTGKELVARVIHSNGPYAALPFVPVDCPSLLPSLLEGELFGFAHGARPEIARAKLGVLAAAGGGTVFLDEISELSPDLQTKLLRALQEKQIRPVGATEPIPIQARILAASSRDLSGLVETGRFRKDLFYRLNVVNMRVPPLRERRSDIALLAAHFLERNSRIRGVQFTFADDALRLMLAYDWPGNVRELEHAIEHACTVTSGPVVHLADLSTQLREHHHQHRDAPEPQTAAAQTAPGAASSAPAGVVPIVELEKQAILTTLRHLNGDKLRAAKLLGIGKTTLYRKLKEYGLGEEFE